MHHTVPVEELGNPVSFLHHRLVYFGNSLLVNKIFSSAGTKTFAHGRKKPSCVNQLVSIGTEHGPLAVSLDF